MKAISFSEYQGRTVSEYGSIEARYTRIGTGDAAVGIMRLGPGGKLGRHSAGRPQLMVVLAGTGRAQGGEAIGMDIGPGMAVTWHEGEEHETSTETGLDLLIIEAADATLGEPQQH